MYPRRVASAYLLIAHELQARRSEAGKWGRRSGTPNRVTSDLREMISTALNEAGGVAYLRRQADENPVAFLGLLGKILPRHIESNQPINVSVSLEDERKQAVAEITEMFASLREPRPALIEAAANGSTQ